MPFHKDLTDDDLHPPQAHAGSHTSGTDDIQSATASQKGLMTATQAAKLDGIESDADVTDAANVAAAIAGAAGKSSPVDADSLALIDSADSNALKEMTLADLKAYLKTYFDTLYSAL